MGLIYPIKHLHCAKISFIFNSLQWEVCMDHNGDIIRLDWKIGYDKHCDELTHSSVY